MSRKKITMATSITSNYTGELALPYVAAATLSGVTLSAPSVRILDNIKFKANIPNVATSGLIAAGACDFLDGSTITLTERVLTPTELMVNVELCKKDWISQWEAVSMGAGRLGQNIPSNIQGFLLEHIAGKVAEDMEYQIWQGEVGGGGSYTRFDGWLEVIKDAAPVGNKFKGGAGAGSTDGSDTAITALSAAGDPTDPAEVIAVMENFLAGVSTQVLQSSDFTIWLNNKVLFALRRAQAALGFKDDYYERNTEFTSFLGYRVAPGYGLPDTHIVAGMKENLVYGTDLLSDQIEANVIDMALTDGSQNVRVVMRFTGGTQVGVVSDIYRYRYIA